MKNTVLISSAAVLIGLTGLLAWGVKAHSANVASANVSAYESLLDDIYGTPGDRYRGEKLLHHRIQNVLKTCMGERGFDYTAPSYSGSSAGVVSPGDLDVATPLQESFGIAARHRAHAQGTEIDSNSGGSQAVQNPDTAAAFDTAMDSCISKAMPLEEEYHPAGQQTAASKLLAELRKVQSNEKAKPLLAEYRQCLQNAGYQAVSRLELYEAALERFPDPEQAWSKIAATKEWHDATEAEQKAATTDKICRTKLYRWAAGEIRPTVNRLSADPEVESVRRGWEKINADFKAAGLE